MMQRISRRAVRLTAMARDKRQRSGQRHRIDGMLEAGLFGTSFKGQLMSVEVDILIKGRMQLEWDKSKQEFKACELHLSA